MYKRDWRKFTRLWICRALFTTSLESSFATASCGTPHPILPEGNNSFPDSEPYFACEFAKAWFLDYFVCVFCMIYFWFPANFLDVWQIFLRFCWLESVSKGWLWHVLSSVWGWWMACTILTWKVIILSKINSESRTPRMFLEWGVPQKGCSI